MARQEAMSSWWMAIASRSSAVGRGRRVTRAMRSSAQKRFTAVGRVARSSAATLSSGCALAGAEGDAVGRGAADGGRAAHHHVADGVGHLR